MAGGQGAAFGARGPVAAGASGKRTDHPDACRRCRPSHAGPAIDRRDGHCGAGSSRCTAASGSVPATPGHQWFVGCFRAGPHRGPRGSAAACRPAGCAGGAFFGPLALRAQCAGVLPDRNARVRLAGAVAGQQGRCEAGPLGQRGRRRLRKHLQYIPVRGRAQRAGHPARQRVAFPDAIRRDRRTGGRRHHAGRD
ncbi:hypothetical protein D3C86_1163500 [compost metagenome]